MEAFRTHQDLFLTLKDSSKALNDYVFLHQIICEKIDISSQSSDALKTRLKKFVCKLKQKWVQSRYIKTKFLKSHAEWLAKDFIYPSEILAQIPSTSSKNPVVRPKLSVVEIYKGNKSYSNSSKSEKLRRSRSLVNNFSLEELLNAVKMSYRKRGMHKETRLLQYLQDSGNNKNIETLFKKKCASKGKIFAPEKALSIFITADLSKFQYISIRNESIRCNNNQWPSYFRLRKEKSNCYPSKNTIQITENYAKVELQSLLDHTTSRVLKNVGKLTENTKFVFTCKWGCDGASGQPRYKQLQTDFSRNEDSVFVSSLVPLRLHNKLTCKDLWVNPWPSSPWYCRPMKFEFVKETVEIVNQEISRVNNEIHNLKPFKINNVQVEYVMALTMVDNKICNVITNTTSAMRCYICNAKPTEMNNLDLVNSKVGFDVSNVCYM